MHVGMMAPNLLRIRIWHPSMGITAANVVTPAATMGDPTRVTASFPRSARPRNGLWLYASARCSAKSHDSPTRMVMETASTIPSDHPATVKMPSTVATTATSATSARTATATFPVNTTMDPTANAVDMPMESRTPSTAAFSVAMRTNMSPVSLARGIGVWYHARLSSSRSLNAARNAVHSAYASATSLAGRFHGVVDLINTRVCVRRSFGASPSRATASPTTSR